MKLLRIKHPKTIALLAIVLPMFLMSTVSAVEYTVGVKAGDWVKYGDISVSWNGTGTEPQYVTDAKQMDWVKMEVQSVSDTTVTMTTTVHYENGTEKPETTSYDVESGQGMTGFSFTIAANLKKGDPVTTQSDALTLNDTVTRRYLGVSRSVNVLDLTYTSGGYTTRLTGYWDQATGIMLELFMKTPDYATTGAYVEYSIKATETNMWTADFLGMILGNLFYVLVIIVVIVVIIVGVFIVKRKKPAPTVTPTQADPEKEP